MKTNAPVDINLVSHNRRCLDKSPLSRVCYLPFNLPAQLTHPYKKDPVISDPITYLQSAH